MVYDLQPYFDKFKNNQVHCPLTLFDLLYANGTTVLTDNNSTRILNSRSQIAVFTEDFGNETSIIIKNSKQYGTNQN